MPSTRAPFAARYTGTMIFLLCFLIFKSHAQSSVQTSSTLASDTRERGIQLYRQGDIRGAAEALRAALKRSEMDADAWYYLGLSLRNTPDKKGTLKAFQTAIKLRPDYAAPRAALAEVLLILFNEPHDAEVEATRALALDSQSYEAHFVIGSIRLKEDSAHQALEAANAALKARPDFSSALLLKSRALLDVYGEGSAVLQESLSDRLGLLKEMTESVDQYLKLKPDGYDADTWRKRVEAVRKFLSEINLDSVKAEDADKIYSLKDVTTKPLFLILPTTPNPSGGQKTFYEEAIRDIPHGVIRVTGVLGADGRVRDVVVTEQIKYGHSSLKEKLTKGIVKAIHKIRFLPALKDGRPVSTVFEHNFRFSALPPPPSPLR